MLIDIESLKPEPLVVHQVYEAEEIRFAHEGAQLSAPVTVDFVLRHKEKDLQIEGSVRTEVRYVCSRCLREFTRPFSAAYSLSYRPHPVPAGKDEEIELAEEDLEVGFYDGIALDVDLMVLEQIELSMPMKIICAGDCKGLCPHCGVNLNERTCSCRTEETDQRLAVLLDFRKKMKGDAPE